MHKGLHSLGMRLMHKDLHSLGMRLMHKGLHGLGMRLMHKGLHGLGMRLMHKGPGYETNAQGSTTFWTHCRLFQCDAFLVQWILYWLHFQQSVEYQDNEKTSIFIKLVKTTYDPIVWKYHLFGPSSPTCSGPPHPAFHFCSSQHEEMREGLIRFLVRTLCKSADGKNKKATRSNNTHCMHDSHLLTS